MKAKANSKAIKAKNPKVFVDRSGVEASKAKVNSAIEKKIKEINLKPEATLQTFLQPIEPNFNRTVQTQIKQLPEDAQGIVLKLQKATLEEVKRYQELKKGIPDGLQNDYKKIIDMFPSTGSVNIADATMDILFGETASEKRKGVAKLVKAIRGKSREVDAETRQTRAKSAKSQKELQDEIDKELKKIEELRKKNPIKMTSEKGKPVPVK